MMAMNPLAMIAQALQPTPDAPQDPTLSDQFQTEWQQAQDFYNRRLQGGDISPEEADSIYLAPVRARWGTISASPQLQDDPKKLAVFNSDFNKSLDSFNAANKRNEIGDSAPQIFNRTLRPTVEKQNFADKIEAATGNRYEHALDDVLNGADISTVNTHGLKPTQISSVMSAYRLRHPRGADDPIKLLLQKAFGGTPAGSGVDDSADQDTSTNAPTLSPSPTNSGIKIISIKKVQ